MRTVLILLLLCPTLASAQTPEFLDRSGNAFVRLCSAIDEDQTTEAKSEPLARCAYYVLGVVQGVEFGATVIEARTGKKVPELFCRPDDVENGQLVRVVVKNIREAPEFAHLPTPDLIINAMRRAYPCK
jgi:Rap1a immunity proteins